uniref:Uncharacterized protein n=1 Tax=Glossina palpalis gambiensis TaxID=67801 RepID=A0A1B0BSL3_9MUSC
MIVDVDDDDDDDDDDSEILIKGIIYYNIYACMFIKSIKEFRRFCVAFLTKERKSEGELFKDLCNRHKLEIKVEIKIRVEMEKDYNSQCFCVESATKSIKLSLHSLWKLRNTGVTTETP